jgi:hypothetical protein
MALRFFYEKPEDIPAALREYYELREGKHVLKVEGAIPEVEDLKTSLTTFRDNNTGLNKKVTELETKLTAFKDVDPTKYADLQRKVADFEKTGVTGASDIEARIAKAVADANKPLLEQVQTLTQKNSEADAKIARRDLEKILTEAGLKGGIAEAALPDFLSRASATFRLEDGKAVPYVGNAILYGKKDVTKHMPVEEWLEGLSKDASHLFKKSTGAGANGNPGPGGKRSISGVDPLEFGRNLESIAKGETIVNNGSN